MEPGIYYTESRDLPVEQVVQLYQANGWSAAQKPDLLMQALRHCHSLVCAWDGDTLIGLGYAISDGFLVVYYPHLLVLPPYQRQGVGQGIMSRLMEKYKDFHMQMLVSGGDTVEFYERCGLVRAGQTVAMWVYAGDEH
jgi:GNAT superfamily N-acetyltransferase